MKSRVAMAIFGIVIIGGAAGAAGALSAPRAPATGTFVAQSDTPTATTAIATYTPMPTDTRAVPTPTRTRVPPTATPLGFFSHGGTITNMDTVAQTFTLNRTGGPYTVNWAGATCRSSTEATIDCSTLANNESVHVNGTQNGSVVTATSVSLN